MAGRYAAFISHASQDQRVAERIEALLGRRRVWLDRSDIRLGALLGKELLANLDRSDAVVLVWSADASKSPWVQSEWIAAANLERPIIPVLVDDAPLPQALHNTLWLRWRPRARAAMAELTRTVARGRRRPEGASVGAGMRLPDPSRDAAIEALARRQAAMFGAWKADGLAAARRVQRSLDRPTAALVARYPLDARVALVWAYHAKNAVLLEHEAEIAAGIRVTDARLAEARWRFLRALWLDPLNAEALNGLGTIAWFDHDLDTAEFFIRAALRREPGYAEAAHDLALVLRLREHARLRHAPTWMSEPAGAERAVPILPASDVRVARAFYAEALGFDVVFDTSEGGRTGLLGLRRGGLELTLDCPMAGHGRRACVSLRVPDADALHEAWKASATVPRPPQDQPWGGRTFELTDPFGNTLFVIGPPRARRAGVGEVRPAVKKGRSA